MIWSLFEDRFRYVILIVGCACLTSISSNLFIFNIAQVCMGSNFTSKHNEIMGFGVNIKPLDYTPVETQLINFAAAIGTAFAAVPFTELYARFGAKWPFFAAGILTAISTFLTPLAAELHFYAFLFVRFLQGISYAADFAAVGALCSSWASLKQNGLFLGVLTSYSPLSSGITNWVGGLICQSRFGWPMIYYVHAIFGLIVFSLWGLLYCDRPQDSRKVSNVELEKIQRDKNQAQINGSKSVPYKILMFDLVIISMWVSAFAEIFSTTFLAQQSPYYISNVLHFSPEKTGIWSAVSRLVQIPVRLICGELSDRLTFLSEDLKLIMFNTITVAGAASIYIMVGFVPEDYPMLSIACFAMVNVVTGAASGGFYKCAVVYARQYSHFVIATCQLLKCASLFMSPVLVAIFVHDAEKQSQWRIIFILAAVFMFLASAMFCKFARSEPAIYTRDDYTPEKKFRRASKIAAAKNDLPQKHTDLVV